MNILEQLKNMTVVVADTGDIASIQKHRPRDATTNPSLLLAAARQPEYEHLVMDALDCCPDSRRDSVESMRPGLEKLAVNFGKEILALVPGRVSVEVDATLSFRTQDTVAAARRLISLFAQEGIDRSRILIKIAATWEGIKAAEQLEKEGIHCNLTLLFSFAQAVACAQAQVQLVSPFVGRILDWHKAKQGVESIPASEDPGVISVKHIYNYYKRFGYETEVMGASFRHLGQIKQLAGCDLLTISPQLLEELAGEQGDLPRQLSAEAARSLKLEKLDLDESGFRWMLNQDAMATEKLAEGIRKFSDDLDLLADYMGQKL